MNGIGLMIIAGEVSGDLHGASLIKELKKREPKLDIYGIGGDKMEAAGMKLIYHINKLSFLGFLEVLKHIPFIRKVQQNLLREIEENNTKHVVLIDYPGFNISLAKKLKKRGNNIYYYISPQIWAWGKHRIKTIKKLISKMLVVFPFEEKLYRDNDVDAVFVGHPLIQEIEKHNYLLRNQLNEKFELDEKKDILLISPGSRSHEVKDIFPEVIKAAQMLAKEKDMQIIVACASGIDDSIFYSLTDYRNFKVVKGFTYDFMRAAKFGIIKSGTSTLEAGLFQLPMVIVYKASRLTFLIGKSLVQIKNIGMANIILNEQVVPELIQDEVKAANIYNAADAILSDSSSYEKIKFKLGLIKQKLGNENAPGNAAEIILNLINGNKAS